MNKGLLSVTALAGLLAMAAPAHAEFQFSAYLGGNLVQDDDVTLTSPSANFSGNVDFDGESFEFPPYWGVRGTYWFEDPAYAGWGVGVDFVHAKAAADPVPAPFTTLEFTDGINILTANVFYRYQNETRYTPYAGVGVGLSIPNVEVAAGGPETDEYQVVGVAAQALVGVDIAIYEDWSVFGEYRFSYSDVDADLNGGGSLETDLLLHHFAIGVSYSF
ncbi:outer membrane protein [Coralliovum pocilloporae]|uniref:outer membrane protein n=1 Tax=Coralliovum pocilloporae TaxID=3066369 RepID=UPI0033075142